jgi:mannose-6-phosphate isomerase-like protein (cupin superfamily)
LAIESVHRVVTCNGADGSSEFAAVDSVPVTATSLDPGTLYWLVWGTSDGVPMVAENDATVARPFFPGPGGSRFIIVQFPPEEPDGNDGAAATEAEVDARRADAEAKLPGLLNVHEADPDGFGFHTTDTIDYVFVVEGSLVLEVDGGRTEALGPGSCVVQRGTRHRWHNPTSEVAVAMFVLLGAERESR